MPETEKEILLRIIQSISEWESGRAITKVEYMFIELDKLDTSKHKTLWNKLRNTLANNKDLNQENNTSFLKRAYMRKDDNWWWNPNLWKG